MRRAKLCNGNEHCHDEATEIRIRIWRQLDRCGTRILQLKLTVWPKQYNWTTRATDTEDISLFTKVFLIPFTASTPSWKSYPDSCFEFAFLERALNTAAFTQNDYFRLLCKIKLAIQRKFMNSIVNLAWNRFRFLAFSGIFLSWVSVFQVKGNKCFL